MNPKGRILGIDYGRTRIGLALSDESQTIASPIGYVINKGPVKTLVAIKELLLKHGAFPPVPPLIMCGIALHTDGSESPMSAETRTFGTFLHENLGVPVEYFDERYSSQAAEQHIRENLGIKNPKKVVELVDTMAATMVLQEYLAQRRKQ